MERTHEKEITEGITTREGRTTREKERKNDKREGKG
jgi:hypothetical protein